MNRITKALNSLLILLLGLSFSLASFVLPTENIFFKSSSYLEALETQKYFEKFPTWLADQILQNRFSGTLNNMPVFAGLDQAGLESIVRLLIPPNYIKVQTGLIFWEIEQYVNFQKDDLKPSIDLTPLKVHFDEAGRDRVLAEIVKNWPACTAEQLFQIVASTATGQMADAPICRPPDDTLPLFVRFLSLSVGQLIQHLPDTLELNSEFMSGFVGQPGTGNGMTIWTGYRLLRTGLRVNPFLSILLLAILGMANFKRWKVFGNSLSSASFIGGGLTILSAGLLFLGSQILGGIVAVRLTAFAPKFLTQNFAGMFEMVIARTAAWSAIAGLGWIGMGIICLTGISAASHKGD